MAFHDVQFPTDISYGSEGGPEWSTEVIELGSGHEKRNQPWEYPRERWNVAYGIKTETLLQVLLAFFYCRAGKTHTFRFKNHRDYEGTDEDLGAGEGDNQNYQLLRNYTSGPTTLARTITKPISGTLSVYVDSVEESSGWAINTSTGLLTFDSPVASGSVVTATFEFDVHMRFDTDFVPMRFSTIEHGGTDVQLLEVKS